MMSPDFAFQITKVLQVETMLSILCAVNLNKGFNLYLGLDLAFSALLYELVGRMFDIYPELTIIKLCTIIISALAVKHVFKILFQRKGEK